mmetsp:Transcript_19609/g.58308  ORF Transcript_19609/g.58308 Transcript_19609/m.58308 type:complete len:216 (-) Transcript_19609:601-1248(-)
MERASSPFAATSMSFASASDTALCGAGQRRNAPSAVAVATRWRARRSPYASKPKAASSTATPTTRPPVRAQFSACTKPPLSSLSPRAQHRQEPSCDAVQADDPSAATAIWTTAPRWPAPGSSASLIGVPPRQSKRIGAGASPPASSSEPSRVHASAFGAASSRSNTCGAGASGVSVLLPSASSSSSSSSWRGADDAAVDSSCNDGEGAPTDSSSS